MNVKDIIRFALRTAMTVFLFVLILSVHTGRTAETLLSPKKAEVVRDFANKQNINGYIHIAFAWGTQLSPPQNYLRGFINLKEAMHRWTEIETTIDNHIYLSSPELLEMPFVYVTTDQAFELTGTEIKNIKAYFDSGGFMVLDNATPNTDFSQAGASLKKMLRDVLGAHARFQPIPTDHQLYHCFFDFDDGPPLGAELQNQTPTGAEPMKREVHYLEGIWYKGRLAAICSDKGYIIKWQEMENNNPQLKMGVNMVVFSLIQEGSIAGK